MNRGALSGVYSGVGAEIGLPSAVNSRIGRVAASEGRFGCFPHSQALGQGSSAQTLHSVNALTASGGGNVGSSVNPFFPGDIGAMVVAGNGNMRIQGGQSPLSSFFHTGGQWLFDRDGGGGFGSYESNVWFKNNPGEDINVGQSSIGQAGFFVAGNVVEADDGDVELSAWPDFISFTGLAASNGGTLHTPAKIGFQAHMGNFAGSSISVDLDVGFQVVDEVPTGAVLPVRVGLDVPALSPGDDETWGVRSLTPCLMYGLSVRKLEATSDSFTFGDLFGAPFMVNTDGLGGTVGTMEVSTDIGYTFTSPTGLSVQDFGDTGPRWTLGHIGAASALIASDGAGGSFGVLTAGSSGFSMSVRTTFAAGLTVASGNDIILGTSVGSRLGSASNQKLGFWGATPITQPGGTTDILASLVSVGVRASGANPPLNMGTGALTAGSVTLGDGDGADGAITTFIGNIGSSFQQIALVGTAGDAQPVAAILGLGNGQGSWELGPGGGANTDVKVKRTGTSAADVVGVFNFTAGLSLPNSQNIVLATGAGTKIGTGATQKLGLWNATPIVQPSGSTDILTGLVNMGARASGANPPLSIGTGALTAGSLTLGDGTGADGSIATLIGNVGVSFQQIVLNGAAGDANGVAVMSGLGNGQGSFELGPGGGSVTDVKLKRTGAAAADFVGQLRVTTGLTFADGINVVLNATTGTKIGTGTTQKLGFWNAAPVAQIAGSTDVLAGLVTLGLRAASSNPPLNLGTGAITAGAITASGNVALGDAITDTIGLYGVTPIAQRAGSAQAAVVTTAPTQTTPWGFSTSAQAAAIITLVNELRAAAVAIGMIKGAA